jgi:hypothetical protein
MARPTRAYLILVMFLHSCLLLAEEPSDLQVQLRSATGSNLFQIGEVIPLEAVLSSSASNRYLEPCELFVERNFGFPQCRFFSRWSFTITPDRGWVDLTKEFPSGPRSRSGPTFEVPNADLSSQPVTFSYVLTKGFRFDAPGTYRVHLSVDIGRDDETTRRKPIFDPTAKPHTVSVTRELEIQIVPARPEWQKEIIHEGYDAYSSPIPRVENPPSPEMLRYQRVTEALCNLGTPEATRVLVSLLSKGNSEVQECIHRTPNSGAAIKEMQRLLIDPDVGVIDGFFRELVQLLDREDSKDSRWLFASQQTIDQERDILVSALPKKRGDAQITSLVTVLHYPPRSKGTPFDTGYDLPFAPSVIEAVAASYDNLPWESRDWLLRDGWSRIRSPLMLPLLRRLAEIGNGPALLRWTEFEPTAAAIFARKEIVRPMPFFSSFYIRLPDRSVSHPEEVQLASNFVALKQELYVARAASLLHRYATRAVLPSVLPFIDANLPEWPCSVEIPVLAYLLKVSPLVAAPHVEEAVRHHNRGTCTNKGCPCNTNTLFTDVGFLQPSPVLERLALSEIDADTPLARDAVDYLRLHGSAATKPFIWKQLVRWHDQYVASGAEKRAKDGAATGDDQNQGTLVAVLIDALVRAQAWVLSPNESNSLLTLLGNQAGAQLSCNFSCGASIAVGPAPARYAIYGRANETWEMKMSPMEYLNPMERLHYSINQYRCANMSALKQKILQFPVGSTFEFAWDFNGADRDELLEISNFLWKHHYKVENPQKWTFLRPDPPR